MTDQELKETVAGLVVSTAELRRELEELRQAQTETSQVLEDWMVDPTHDQWCVELRELSDERMKVAAMDRLLFGRLGMRDISQGARVRTNGSELVIGVLACDNVERKEVIIVEERCELTTEDIQEILEKIEQFPGFFRLYRDCKSMACWPPGRFPQNCAMKFCGRDYIWRALAQNLQAASAARIQAESFRSCQPNHHRR